MKDIDYKEPLALSKNATGPSKPLDKVGKLSKIATGQSGPVGPEKSNESLQKIKVIESTSKKERDLKRPIVHYTEILNSLTDVEWASLKLPPVCGVVSRPNKQLPDLSK